METYIAGHTSTVEPFEVAVSFFTRSLTRFCDTETRVELLPALPTRDCDKVLQTKNKETLGFLDMR